jgi:5-methylcytosine-specific restriction endonuclease McrA
MAKTNAELCRERREKYPERVKEQARRDRQAHPERELERKRRWAAKNPEKRRAIARRTRARAHARAVTLTGPQWGFTLEWFNSSCVYCGRKLGLIECATLEHFVPLAAGGDHVIGNCAPACQSCNSSKHDKLPEIWMAARGLNYKGLRAELDALVLAWGELELQGLAREGELVEDGERDKATNYYDQAEAA